LAEKYKVTVFKVDTRNAVDEDIFENTFIDGLEYGIK